jgi:putative flippase GtrA
MIRGTVSRLLGDERFRFLIVGGINTAVGYGLFAAFQLSVGGTIGYLGSLYASYAIAIVLAFVLHRRFTFRIANTDDVFIDFLRFSSVYVVSLAINTVALPVAVRYAKLNPLAAQAIIVIAVTVLTYFAHKLFSFRRKPDPADAA